MPNLRLSAPTRFGSRAYKLRLSFMPRPVPLPENGVILGSSGTGTGTSVVKQPGRCAPIDGGNNRRDLFCGRQLGGIRIGEPSA